MSIPVLICFSWVFSFCWPKKGKSAFGAKKPVTLSDSLCRLPPGVIKWSSYDWSIGTNAALWLVFRATWFFLAVGLRWAYWCPSPLTQQINGDTLGHTVWQVLHYWYLNIGWFIAIWEFLVDFSFLNCVRVECWNHYERVCQGWPIIGQLMT